MFYIDIIVVKSDGSTDSSNVHTFTSQKGQIDFLSEVYRDYIGAEQQVPIISADGTQVTLRYADRIAFIYPY